MPKPVTVQTKLQGLAISPGVAVARICLFNESRHSDLPSYRITPSDVDSEIARLRGAQVKAIARLEQIRSETARNVGESEAGIFMAQKMILEDHSVLSKIIEAIAKRRVNVETAVTEVFDAYEARLLAVDDEYIKERATDIGEVRRRLLDILRNIKATFQCQNEQHCVRGYHRIVVAEELTPSLTMELDREHTLGFITERGGPVSHAAILARALGIPAVSGIRDIRSIISCGTEVLINGNTGEVVIAPDETTVGAVKADTETTLRMPTAEAPVQRLKVMANISLASDAEEALAMKAEGIGLYRTEFEFMVRDRVLDEQEQAELYTRVVLAMAGKPVFFRLLDLGSDKTFPALGLPREDNPAMGWRGLRLLADRPDLLESQARALASASREGSICILYPMVVDRDQFLRLKEMVVAAMAGIEHGTVRHGAMFEVPAACLQAHEILAEADHASIGTNDLVQYLFAVDRNNERVAQDYSPDRQVLWDLIGNVATAANATGKPLSVCGELAGDPRYTAKLMAAGIKTVSVSARLIPELRRAARRAPEGGASA